MTLLGLGDYYRPVQLVPSGSEGPQWREKPTGPGWWVVRDFLWREHHMPPRSTMRIADEADMRHFDKSEGVMVYGTIPECELQTKGG